MSKKRFSLNPEKRPHGPPAKVTKPTATLRQMRRFAEAQDRKKAKNK